MELEDVFEDKNIHNLQRFGPFYYGYTMSIGPDGKPIVREYSNVKPGLPTSETREPLVDTLVDEKDKLVKLVAEMPGVEKKDIKVVVQDKTVQIDAEHGDKNYHVKVPIKPKFDENTAKASYTNGILELVFKLKEEPKPKGKTVEVE
jgi:HSP20 family protein